MFCTKCGTKLDDGLRFCTKCGAAMKAPATSEDAQVPESARQEASLPDVALEPQRPEPVADTVALESQAAELAPAAVAAPEAAPQATAGEAPRPRKGGRKAAIIGSSIAAVAVVALVALFALGVFDPATPINPDSFPNDLIRGAVSSQLDEDGDGRLSDEEAGKVSALVYTDEGVRFVTDGAEVDAQALREQIAQDPIAQPEAAGDQQQGTAAGSSESVRASLGDLATFPNIKTIVADDSGLSQVDLAQIPNVEYVDLRGNPGITELDLSANTQLKTLFCDPEVVLTGLDEAGLYFQDLITNVEVTSGTGDPTRISVEYDSHARPVSAWNRIYEYDEQGRVVHVRQKEFDDGSFSDSYSYGQNGLLSSSAQSMATQQLGVPALESAFGYDAEGNLTQMSGYWNGEQMAGTFEYVDGTLASWKGSNGAMAFSMDEAGRLASSFEGHDDYQTTQACAYSQSGNLAEYTQETVWDNGSGSERIVATAYDEAGAPVKTALDLDDGINGEDSFDISYTCNGDGYITGIKWGEGKIKARALRGQSATVSYVKRVGALADRAAERFVPRWRVAFEQSLFRGLIYSRGQIWFSSSVLDMPIGFVEFGPEQVLARHMGLDASMLDSPNELALAAYDREHWADGLSLGQEQPMGESEDTAKLMAKAAKAQLPTPPSAFLNDAVYGSLVRQYLQLSKDVQKGRLNVDPEDYPDIPEQSVDFSSNLIANSTEAMSFSYADMNGDGVNELFVNFPDGYGVNDEGFFIAAYGAVDGKPVCMARSSTRDLYSLTQGGEIFYQVAGSGTYGTYAAYRWDGSTLALAEELSWDNSSKGITVTRIDADGGKETSTVSIDKLSSVTGPFREAYPSAEIAWTTIAA